MNLQDVIDIEEYAASGREHPVHVKAYRIRIDREYHVVDVPELTGGQLLELAHKMPPEHFSLHEKRKGASPRKVELNEKVSFRTPGIERFLTLPLDQTEGLVVPPRRQFQLPPEDELFLNGCAHNWEAVVEEVPGGAPVRRVVVYGVTLPPGYNHSEVDIHYRIEALYPDTQIDMAYLHPAVARQDGQLIANLSDVPFDGKVWQQWSRHRTGTNPWRPAIDSLETHFLLTQEWFKQEFRKR